MKRLIPAALGVMLVLAACQDSTPTAAPTTTVPPTTTTAAPTTTTTPPTTAAPTTVPTTVPPATTLPPTTLPPLTATRAVDGDTIEVSGGSTIRIVGIDTPERGQCGYAEATEAMAAMVEGQPVVLVATGKQDDLDRYGRLLRYVEVNGVDVGLVMIEQGYAHARYDSRDGYGFHDREPAYVAADAASPDICAPAPTPAPAPKATPAPTPAPAPKATPAPAAPSAAYYPNCAAVRAAGKAPLYRGEPGYSRKLDRDGDGVACE